MFNDDFNKFKTHLRDFLISLKEFAGDNAELYAEEREQALRDSKAAERDRAMRVGGLLKPSEMDQEDELWLEEEVRSEFAIRSSTGTEYTGKSNFPAGNDSLDGWSLYGLWRESNCPNVSHHLIGVFFWTLSSVRLFSLLSSSFLAGHPFTFSLGIPCVQWLIFFYWPFFNYYYIAVQWSLVGWLNNTSKLQHR